MNNKETKKDVYFLKDNEEVKIVTKTKPYKQIFITNKNGVLLVEDYFSRKERLNKKNSKKK